jgi:hypothetical protein
MRIALQINKKSAEVTPSMIKYFYGAAMVLLLVAFVVSGTLHAEAEFISGPDWVGIEATSSELYSEESIPAGGMENTDPPRPFGVIAGSEMSYAEALNLISDLGGKWVRINNNLDGKDQNLRMFLDANVNLVITFNNADPTNIETTYGTIAEWPNAGFPFKSKTGYQQRIQDSLTPILSYLPTGKVWVQCENEASDASVNPNSRYWRGTTDEYLTQLQAFYEVVRSIDPSIPVVLTSFPSETLDAILDPSDPHHSLASAHLTKLLTGQYDSVDLHFYGCLEDIPPKIQCVKGYMPEGKLWISTENGGPDSRCPSTPISWDQNPTLFEQIQAQQVPARLAACADNGGSICLWFSLFDLLREKSSVFSHLGLVDLSVRPPRKKPAYDAFKSFVAYHDLNVSINPTNAGTVTGLGINCPEDCTESYSSSAIVQLTATPSTGYHFVAWSGDMGSSDNPVNISMGTNQSITANFAINSYLLTVTKTGTGNGTVTGTGLNCSGNTCTGMYPYSLQILVTANPDKGSTVIWTGCDSTNGNLCTVTMTSAKNITATFSDAPPIGSITINNGAIYTRSTKVILRLSADGPSGVSQMCVSNTATCTSWISYSTIKSWHLPKGDGAKTVYVFFKDGLGNANASPYSDSIILDTTVPIDGTFSAAPGGREVSLGWGDFSDATSGIANYTLVVSTKKTPSSCSKGAQIYSGSGTSFIHAGLTNGTTYYYRLCPTDNAGNTSRGKTVNARPEPSGSTGRN